MVSHHTQKYRVVVIGGGTGIYPVTTALKQLPTDISTIIAVSDSGGSTGRIRDEFGFPPVGDLRQSLAALAKDDGQEWIRKLLLYRFEKGSGLNGHNLGNLILTALQDMTGSTNEALSIAHKIFRIGGHVIPTTNQNVNLKIVYQNGKSEIGEHIFDDSTKALKVDHIELVPPADLNPDAAKAIKKADLIIIGPGDYYASLMAALAPNGMKAALSGSSAQIIYICNLMTRLTQTHQMSVKDHVQGIEQAIGRTLDHILINNQSIPPTTLKMYSDEGEEPVKDDTGNDQRVIKTDLLSEKLFEKSKVDTTHRSLLRHNSQKLKTVFSKLLNY